MKRKSKLMLGISAMVLAAGVVGATGTFAWFSTVPTATVNNGTADTASITCQTNTDSLGTFTVTPILRNEADNADFTTGAVAPSDVNGDVWVGADGAKGTKVSANNALSTTYQVIKVKFTISYSGPIDNATDIGTAWAAAAVNFTATISETTAYADSAPSAAIVTALGSGKALDGKTQGTHYGLKYKEGSGPSRATNGWTNSGTTELAKSSIDVSSPGDFSEAAGSGTYTSSVTTGVVATFYVGVIGIDGVVQAAGDTYGLSVAVTH